MRRLNLINADLKHIDAATRNGMAALFMDESPLRSRIIYWRASPVIIEPADGIIIEAASEGVLAVLEAREHRPGTAIAYAYQEAGYLFIHVFARGRASISATMMDFDRRDIGCSSCKVFRMLQNRVILPAPQRYCGHLKFN